MIPFKHIRHQGPVIGSLARTALSAALGRGGGPGGAGEVSQVLPPRPPDLVRDYVRAVGGDPASYRQALPPHLFCQWGFPAAARTLVGQPYPLHRVLNGGCRLEANAPLPIGAPLYVTARLEDADDDGRRVLFRTRVWTGTDERPDAVVGDIFAVVPTGGGGEKKSANGSGNGEGRSQRKERPRVSADARELAYWKIPADAGLRFAVLTGDVNPLHWIPPYARAMGFKNTILHGFATMGRAWEGLVRSLASGEATGIRAMDVRFTRPLVLPARVGLYVDGDRVAVGDAPGGPAYMTGTFATSFEGENR